MTRCMWLTADMHIMKSMGTTPPQVVMSEEYKTHKANPKYMVRLLMTIVQNNNNNYDND